MLFHFTQIEVAYVLFMEPNCAEIAMNVTVMFEPNNIVQEKE